MWARIRKSPRLKDLIAAMSLGNLYFVSIWNEFQDPTDDYLRLVPHRTWATFGQVLLHLAFVALCFWMFIAALGRTRSVTLRRAGSLTLLLVLLLGLDVVRTKMLHVYGAHLSDAVGRTGALTLCGAVGAWVVWASVSRERAALQVMRTTLVALSFLAPINILSTAAFVDGPSYRARFAAKPALPLLAPSPAPRIIWVIFDEWDYYRTFPGRTKGLHLPELDRFAAQALAAETVYPPAHDMMESLPSLITGKMVTLSTSAGPDQLLLRYLGEKETVSWSSQPNVFQDARSISVNSAVVGFYHPYQRILSANFVQGISIRVDEGEYWNSLKARDKIAASVNSVLLRIPYTPLITYPLAKHMPYKPPVTPQSQREKMADFVYTRVNDEAAKVITRRELGLVLLHYPIPHPPAVHPDPNGDARGDIRAGDMAAYDDNLAVLDHTLAGMRSALEKAGEWDDAAVLLSSDHPLRMLQGRKEYPWIPFLLKLPGQRDGASYRSPFNSILTRELIRSLLLGEVKTSRDAASWLDRHRLNYPVEPPPRTRPFADK